MFIKTVFKSSFCLAYVLFVVTPAVYHVDEVFGVAVDMIRDGFSFPSGRKCVIGEAVGYVVAGVTVTVACKGFLVGVGLFNST